jgi:xylulokinase
MSLMGVDIGTTGVKAVVFDMSGKQIASSYEEYPMLFPCPGGVELDSQLVMESACRAVAQSASEVAQSDPVAAIGIASHGESFTPIDAEGRIIGNAMPSTDSRAAAQLTRWTEGFGSERLYQITGHAPYPMHSLFKMEWLKENRPDLWEKAAKFLFYVDLLAFVLTGETRTEYTLAARSMLFDVSKNAWSDEILDRLGLNADRLAEVVPPGTVAGVVRPDTAASLGLRSDVSVIVCGHDQPVGALGCGAASPGLASYAIGTVECICPSLPRLVLSPQLMDAKLAVYPHVLPDKYTTVAFNMTGGSVLKWVRDNLATEEASAARTAGDDPYTRIMASASSVPSDLVLLPHFGPTGTPHFDPTGVGVLFGMNLSTSRGEVLRAFLEGITYEMKWNLSILKDAGFELTELRAIGGGARNDRWMQIKADILGIPITTMQVTEATCLGAAILAGSGVGLFDADETSRAWATPVATFEPQQSNGGLYQERFAIYQEAYTSLSKARQMLHDLRIRETK